MPVYQTRIGFLLSLIPVAIFLSGCGQSLPPREEREIKLATEKQDKPEIPLDKNIDGSHASTVRNFYVIFDGSGSMANGCGGGDKQFSSKLDGAKWALHEFIKKVPVDTNLGLYVFDGHHDTPKEVVPLGGQNRDKFLKAVDEVRAGGGTPLADAMRFGADRLIEQYQRQLGYGEYRLVVITDGQANDLASAVKYTLRYRFAVPIYAIGFCIDEDHPLRRFAFSYRQANSSADLARGLEDTLGELSAFDSRFTPN